MITPTFSEVIKVKDGLFYNLTYHQARMNSTASHYFGKTLELNLTPDMIPLDSRSGLVKCRVVYSDEILSLEFIPYSFRLVTSVEIVHDDTIEYSYKSTDRRCLNNLLRSSGCDEIIIVKNGFVTDSSSANLVFEDPSGLFTPASYLLPGTKRKYLLDNGIISERNVKLHDLKKVTKVYLINAMIDLEDNVTLPVMTSWNF